jgi:hypothetical protein
MRRGSERQRDITAKASRNLNLMRRVSSWKTQRSLKRLLISTERPMKSKSSKTFITESMRSSSTPTSSTSRRRRSPPASSNS